MAKIFTFISIFIVVFSSINCEQRPLLRYSNYIQKAIPNHWQYDEEKLSGRVNKIARRPQVNVNVLHRLPFSPVNSNKKVLWEKWTQEERLAAFQRNKNKDLQKVRTRLLQEKLKLNHLQSRQRIVQPQIKHKTDGKQQTIMRAKREVQDTKFENIEKQQETQQSGQYFRPKRDIITNAQVQPELVLQPHIKVPYQKENEAQYQEKISEKRGKRQTLYTIIRSPLMFYQKRTTRNPFIPQTNIDDYENVQPDPMEQYRPEPEVVRNDGDSYQISEIQNIFSIITRKLLSLKNWLKTGNDIQKLQAVRIKRSPKMSKLHKRQKKEKKKKKKKKQKILSPRQIKHYRRIREHKEERRRILHKKLKEKRRLKHKKMGTGPYNKTIIDYYGIYFDPPSSQINESLYNSIYDSSAIDSDKMYEEQIKNYPDSDREEYENRMNKEHGGSKEEFNFEQDSGSGGDSKVKEGKTEINIQNKSVESLDTEIKNRKKPNENLNKNKRKSKTQQQIINILRKKSSNRNNTDTET